MSEKVTVKVERSVLHLPAIALRGLVVFPNNLLHFEVGREKSIAAVEWAVSNNSDVFLVAQKEMKVEDPKSADLYTYGVVAEVKQVMRVSDDLVRILVEGKYRAKLSEMEDDGSFLLATVRPAPVKMAKPEEMPEADVLVRNVKKSFDELLALNPHIGKDVVFAITTSTDPAFLSEYIPANLLFRFEDKQAILDEGTLMGRLRLLIEKMHRERRMLEIDKEIAQKVDEAMDKNQRDYYLHEQLHMISEELGEDDDTTAEAEEYRRKITALHLDEDREKKLLKEVDRLSKMQSSNQEGTVIRTYLDTCLDLPWNTFTEDDLDIAKAQRVLDRDHYGLKKVKDRILEVLAVRKLAPDVKGQIICLVGPPGVGKTSIARSILRILPDPPAKVMGGEIWFDGEDNLSLPEKKMRTIRGNKISMIFQDPMTALNPIMTVGSQISEAIRLHNNITRAEADKQAIKMLEMVGIPGQRFGNYPLEFSGGMKQRVVIAMALACKPRLLLADEPTTALDVTIQGQILALLGDLSRERGMGLLLITHDLGVVAEMADEVGVMYAGRIVERAPVRALFAEPRHPYTWGLIRSAPTLDTPPSAKLDAIPGTVPSPGDLPQGCPFRPRCPEAHERCFKTPPVIESAGADGAREVCCWLAEAR